MLKAKSVGILGSLPTLHRLYAGLATRRRVLGGLALLLVALLTAGLAGLLLWAAGPAQAQDGDAPTPVENLRCIAETDRVAFLWDAPEWSGGEIYAYDYRLTLPDGREESGRLGQGITLVLRPGSYQKGKAASVSVKAVYETSGGRQVSSAAATLTCYVGGEPETPNQAPTVANSIGDAAIFHESGTQQVSLTGVFDDADNDSLSVTAASSDEAVASVSVASDYSTLTVRAQARGIATITATADDGRDGTVSDAFTVTVKAAPVVASPLADISGLEVKATREVSLSGVFSDADGDSLTVTAASGDEAMATVSVAADQSKLTVAGVAEGTATITVTAQDADGNTVSDAFDVSVVALPQQQQQSPALSSDATLSGLVLLRDGSGIPLRPAFDPRTAQYGATVPLGGGWAALRPTANHAGATITVDGKTVSSGSNSEAFFLEINTPKRVVVSVTAEDGKTRRDYAVTATHAPRAELSGLSISQVKLHPFFSGLHADYRGWVAHGVASVTVTPINRYAKGTITVNGQTVVSGAASPALALAEGENVITVTITGPDDHTSRSYTVTLHRASAMASGDATLSGLSVHRATSNQPDAGNNVPYAGDAYTLTPALTAGVYDYRVRVPEPSGAERLYLTTVATTTAPGARSIVVSGKSEGGDTREPKREVVTGEASGPWMTFVGYGLITIAVTSLDGSSVQTYRVLVEQGSVDDPQGVAVAPGDGSLTLSWGEPTGSNPPELYWARWREAGTGAWLNKATLRGWKTAYGDDAPAGTAADGQRMPSTRRTYAITGLTNGTEYEVELRGTRGGDTIYGVTNWLKSGWVSVRGTPGEATRPLTITPSNATREYGGTDDLSYTVGGLMDGDAAGDVVTGALSRAVGNDAGSYAISMGTLAIAPAHADKYTLPAGPAVTTYTITPRAITAVSGVTVNSRPADGSTAATFDTSSAQGVGVLAAELADFRAGGLLVSGTFPAATPGTHDLSVTYSLQDHGTFKAANYTLSAATATLQGELTEVAPPADCQLPARDDYDADNDGLIEVCNLAQLNAIRWDLDGNAVHIRGSLHEYTSAFPGIIAHGAGCPASGCRGYELSADLDFDTNGSGVADAGDEHWNDGRGWAPIGVREHVFTSVFDGNGFTIGNLFIDSAAGYDYVGLFMRNHGTIRNVRLENVDVSAGGDMVGALAGDNHGAISHSRVTGTVTGDHDVGGLAGENHGTISSSSADANVSSVAGDSPGDTGGLVGENFGRISHSHSTGTVSGKFAVGGLVGKQFNTGYVQFSHSAASVTGTHGPGDGGSGVGGLVGNNNGRISASYATGTVSGKAVKTGGLVGLNDDGGTIIAGYALGPVSSLLGNDAGGLVGRNRGSIRASFAAGRVHDDSNRGGLVGWTPPSSSGRVTDSYWDTQATRQTKSDGGTGKTTAELQSPTGYTGIYANWNQVDLDGDGHPDDVWEFGDTGEYPVLKDEIDPTVSTGPVGSDKVILSASANLRTAHADERGVLRMTLPAGATIDPEFGSNHHSYRLTVPAEMGHLTFTGRFASEPYTSADGQGFAILVAGLLGEYEKADATNDHKTFNRVVIATPQRHHESNRIALAPDAVTMISIGVYQTRPGRPHDFAGSNKNISQTLYTLAVTRGAPSEDDATLGYLAISAGALEFDPDDDLYRVEVAQDTTSVTFAPVALHPQAAVAVNGEDPSTPVALDQGENVVSIVVTAADGVATQTYTITVVRGATLNRAPTVSAAIADVTIVNESGTHQVSLSGVFSDADNDSLTITAASSDETKATVSLASDQSSLTVNAQIRGEATITVTADDGKGGTVEETFTVTVKAAPVVASALADVTGLEAGATQEVSLSGTFNDADGDTLTITAESSDETKATVIVASDGSSLTVAGVAEGTVTITVTAQDSDGNQVGDTFDAPVARKYASLIGKMYEWRNDSRYVNDKAHTDRWDRALLTFGETVPDTTLTPMTASEAQGYADRGWSRWVEVAAALREIESG